MQEEQLGTGFVSSFLTELTFSVVGLQQRAPENCSICLAPDTVRNPSSGSFRGTRLGSSPDDVEASS